MKSNLLKKHAKSFYWASFFLSSNTLDKCSSLYNFCRTLDDIVDDDNNLEIKKEIFLAGIDLIDKKLTEINITSPTGMRQIANHSKAKLNGRFFDLLEKI